MPTPIFCCGAECGIVAIGASGTGVRHWDTVTGTPTVDTGTFRSGTRSYKFTTAAAAQQYLGKTFTGTPTLAVARAYVNFSALPSTDCMIMSLSTAAGNYPSVSFKAADSKLYAALNLSFGSTGVSVTTGVWYRLDLKGDCSGATRTVDVQVDGTALSHSAAIAASNFVQARFGCNTTGSSASNGTHFFDDIIVSTTTGDYPFGAGAIVGLYPNADGTHSYDTAGDFQYNGSTNVPTGATDTWSYIDDPLDNITDFIAIPAASNTEYLEWQFADLPSVASINGLEVAQAYHANGTGANKTTLRLNDNGTLSDVATDLDFSNTTITYHTKHYATAPSTSAAWTKTGVDALRARGNSSYGTVDESAVPYIDGICFEVDYVPSAATQPLIPNIYYKRAVHRAAYW